MWTRNELKSDAKVVISKYYWMIFLAILAIGAIVGAVHSPVTFVNTLMQFPKRLDLMSNRYGYRYFPSFNPIMSSFSLLINIFVAYPLSVGLNKFLLKIREDKVNFPNLFMAFTEKNYLSVVASMLWMSLFNFLWYLLFIIPGIVKSIAYSMTPYILADNPQIGYQRALKLSIAMTDGHKLDIFVLGLSFIGWILLGLMACGIGVFFVTPYISAAYAELYVKLRTIAIDKGICTADELNLESVEVM